MTNRHFAHVAGAFAFTIFAAACSSSEHAHGPLDIASTQNATATPEFHGAAIGDDALRGQLGGE